MTPEVWKWNGDNNGRKPPGARTDFQLGRWIMTQWGDIQRLADQSPAGCAGWAGSLVACPQRLQVVGQCQHCPLRPYRLMPPQEPLACLMPRLEGPKDVLHQPAALRPMTLGVIRRHPFRVGQARRFALGHVHDPAAFGVLGAELFCRAGLTVA